MTFDDFPSIWGPGQLLAFSGVDGHTSWFEPFVLHTGTRPGDLQVKLPADLPVVFSDLGELRFDCITGDAIVSDRFTAVFADHHTLLGTVPAGVSLRIGDQDVQAPTIVWTGDDVSLLAGCHDGRWFLARRKPEQELAVSGDVQALIAARLAYLKGIELPAGLSPAQRRLLRKAISIAKVNVEAPAGCIRHRWSTPDRWPHRHMWLWDSAFHAVGMAHFDLGLAQDAILAMLEQVTDDGCLPHTIYAGDEPSAITQPPLLAWAVLTLLGKGADREWAIRCRRYLYAYLEWDRRHRDQNGNGIPEWHIHGEPLCRCGESGLDNSPVYDGAVLLDAPDFGSFLAHDYDCLAEICRQTDADELAERCEEQAGLIGARVRKDLWWAERQFFFHRDFSGQFVDSEAVSGFMPLFAGIASAGQAAALVRHLSDPAMFGAPAPVPSLSLRSGTFSKDMWRGPSWLNLSYLVYLGLRRYGYNAEASNLKDSLLTMVGHWYEQTGCLWEYYDSLGLTEPSRLDRKQRLISGSGIGPISDYHWTAAITAALLFEDHQQKRIHHHA